MKTRFVKDLEAGEEIMGLSFALNTYENKTAANGSQYLNLALSDKTGEINAKIWEDNLNKCDKASVGDIVAIDGTVSAYKGSLQITIKSMQKLEVDKNDLSDFLPTSKADIDKLFKNIEKTIISFDNQYIKKLLSNIFKDKDFQQKFKQAPAAEKIHHAYLGGLVEHLSEMLGLAEKLCELYPNINKDLLIAGVLLHDTGKMDELTMTTCVQRTTAGYLLGHISIIAMRVNEEIKKIENFPEELKLQILHLILSHHGELGFGSPVKPMTTEAWALHYIDQLSTKVNISYNITEELKGQGIEFSDKVYALDNKLFIPQDSADDNKKTLF